MVRVGWLLVLAIGVAGITGCGPKTDKRGVSGKVTLDGTLLNGGSIRFTSVKSEKLMSSGAMIRDGEYKIPAEKGLLPGTYHLEINAPDSKAKPVWVKTSADGQGVMTQPERIPAEYNVDSTKTIDVTADGNNQFDFSIVSKPAK